MSTAHEKVQLSRAKGRPTALSFVEALFTDFVEMHGDRRFGDDPAVVAGIARLEGAPVTVVGIEKGQTTRDKVHRNFGSPNPEGYRKALRQMKLAEKFGRPVICLVDTAGAYCGLGAEERGQGLAIAENMSEMMALGVPIVTVMIGEGGSGGALALAVADEVWMMENAYYSVISPEGAASILWKDAKRSREAAECLKLTAQDLLGFQVIERILPESGDFAARCGALRAELSEAVGRYAAMADAERLDRRYHKYRRIGVSAP